MIRCLAIGTRKTVDDGSLSHWLERALIIQLLIHVEEIQIETLDVSHTQQVDTGMIIR
jgi:hypothetical protein